MAENKDRFENAPMVWSGDGAENPDGVIDTYAAGDNPAAAHENYFRYQTQQCIEELQQSVGAMLYDPPNNASGVVLGGEASESIASGYFSIAGGRDCTATCPYAIALGWRCEATETYAVAIGAGLIASCEAQFVIGEYNEETDGLFVIGDGTSDDTRHNLLTVTKDGKVNLCSDESDAGFYLNGEKISGGDVSALEARVAELESTVSELLATIQAMTEITADEVDEAFS